MTPRDTLIHQATTYLSVLNDTARRREGACLIEQLLTRVRELEAWKAQQLAVENEWDAQAAGRLLGVPLGQSIRAAIRPGIEKLQQRVAELEGQVGELRDALVQAAIPLEAINGSVSWELCKPLQESVSVAVKILRSTLPATAPKEKPCTT